MYDNTLGKLNRGRGMMPGIGYIGGRLSIVGGYSWPGAVDLIEEWDEDRYSTVRYIGIQYFCDFELQT